MNAITTTQQRPSLIAKMAGRYNVDADKMLTTLKATAFKSEKPISNEQMMALLIVADQYSLNPFTREIFAFDDKRSGIVPVVSVDGWSRIINEHPQFDGLEFRYSDKLITMPGARVECPEWCEVTIYRKDRAHPTVVREYLDEVYRPPFRDGQAGPWQTHPKRFCRHKTLIQGSRVAFGFAGIYDPDEADRIVRGESVVVDLPPQASRTEQAKALLSATPAVVEESAPVEPEVVAPEVPGDDDPARE